MRFECRVTTAMVWPAWTTGTASSRMETSSCIAVTGLATSRWVRAASSSIAARALLDVVPTMSS